MLQCNLAVLPVRVYESSPCHICFQGSRLTKVHPVRSEGHYRVGLD